MTSSQVQTQAPESQRHSAVALWLYVVAGLVFCMIVVGGATRLTDSGLSITEWKPIMGAIPPLSVADWQTAFEKYKQIPEYEQVNKNITLDGFKTIFWWEWGHRFFGRFIGLAFAIPFLYFLFTGALTKSLSFRLAGIFFLGGLQGLIGWYMVMSGLVDRVDVSPYRLALHLTVAFIILGALLWVAMDLKAPAKSFGVRKNKSGLSRFAFAIVALLLVQVVLGAFVAGTKAGYAYTTWPDMNGEWIPSDMAALSPWYRNFVEDIALVQFNHRIMAYLIGAVVLLNFIFAVLTRPKPGAVIGFALLLLGCVLAQMALGIWTLLNAVPIHLGIAHQGLAAIVFGVAVAYWHFTRRQAARFNF